MKYLVKNRKTGEETLCEKVEVGGYEYYISEGDIIKFDYYLVLPGTNQPIRCCSNENEIDYSISKKVIATNNKSLELPQVVVDNFELWVEYREKRLSTMCNSQYWDMHGSKESFLDGLNKAKETYQFTKDDMVEFTDWIFVESFKRGTSDYTTEELLDIWQEQRTIKIEVE